MSHAAWYATRGSGVVALLLLTLVLVSGIAGSLRVKTARLPRFLVVGAHRSLTLLAVAFVAVHVITTVLDSYTPISLRDAFIPFLASYRPLWLGLGAVAFDLLLALTVTSLLRVRIGYRGWRLVHWLAYAAWPVALLHGLGTGSDSRFGWLQVLSAACVLAVLGAAALRLRSAPGGTQLLLGGAAALATVLGIVWFRSGPDAPGWAARSGTPQHLLATPAAQRTSVTAARTASPAPSVPTNGFHAQLDGKLTTHIDRARSLVLLDIRGRTHGGVDGLLWIRLQGVPMDGGGVQMTASGAAFGPRAAPNAYTGSVSQLQGTFIALSLKNANGNRLALNIQLSLDRATGRVSGTVHGQPE